jgi:hypothetical protein
LKYEQQLATINYCNNGNNSLPQLTLFTRPPPEANWRESSYGRVKHKRGREEGVEVKGEQNLKEWAQGWGRLMGRIGGRLRKHRVRVYLRYPTLFFPYYK